ncbi:MAG: hypothetical protein IJW28_00790, partial [Clostridia bacterium]|nr:hypothetical protein [Clostridia bacterium]
MYSFRVDDKVTKKAIGSIDASSKKNNSLEELVDSINKINHSLDLGGTNMDVKVPTFERLDNVKIDDNKIKTEAEKELQSYKDAGYNKINTDATSKLEKLNTNKQSLKNNYTDTISNLDKYYDNARKTVSNDALSRGLAR